MKYAVKLIFLKCIFKFMINTAPPALNNDYGREKLFWYDKINFQIMCVTEVQWSRVACKLMTREKPKTVKTCPSSEIAEFFSVLVNIMTNNKQYTTNWCTNLHPTPSSGPLAKVKLAFVHRLNRQYYYPKISTGFAPKK